MSAIIAAGPTQPWPPPDTTEVVLPSSRVNTPRLAKEAVESAHLTPRTAAKENMDDAVDLDCVIPFPQEIRDLMESYGSYTDQEASAQPRSSRKEYELSDAHVGDADSLGSEDEGHDEAHPAVREQDYDVDDEEREQSRRNRQHHHEEQDPNSHWNSHHGEPPQQQQQQQQQQEDQCRQLSEGQSTAPSAAEDGEEVLPPSKMAQVIAHQDALIEGLLSRCRDLEKELGEKKAAEKAARLPEHDSKATFPTPTPSPAATSIRPTRTTAATDNNNNNTNTSNSSNAAPLRSRRQGSAAVRGSSQPMTGESSSSSGGGAASARPSASANINTTTSRTARSPAQNRSVRPKTSSTPVGSSQVSARSRDLRRLETARATISQQLPISRAGARALAGAALAATAKAGHQQSPQQTSRSCSPGARKASQDSCSMVAQSSGLSEMARSRIGNGARTAKSAATTSKLLAGQPNGASKQSSETDAKAPKGQRMSPSRSHAASATVAPGTAAVAATAATSLKSPPASPPLVSIGSPPPPLSARWRGAAGSHSPTRDGIATSPHPGYIAVRPIFALPHYQPRANPNNPIVTCGPGKYRTKTFKAAGLAGGQSSPQQQPPPPHHSSFVGTWPRGAPVGVAPYNGPIPAATYTSPYQSSYFPKAFTPPCRMAPASSSATYVVPSSPSQHHSHPQHPGSLKVVSSLTAIQPRLRAG